MPSSKQSKKMEQVSRDSDQGHEKVIGDSFYFRLHNILSACDMTFASLAYA